MTTLKAEDTPRAIHRMTLDISRCIGCARCKKVCPNDAVSGARRFLHRVIYVWCSGCGACVNVCPTDCFSPEKDASWWRKEDANLAKERAIIKRGAVAQRGKDARHLSQVDVCVTPAQRKATINAALSIARARRQKAT